MRAVKAKALRRMAKRVAGAEWRSVYRRWKKVAKKGRRVFRDD